MLSDERRQRHALMLSNLVPFRTEIMTPKVGPGGSFLPILALSGVETKMGPKLDRCADVNTLTTAITVLCGGQQIA